jgi:hypothetical protein
MYGAFVASVDEVTAAVPTTIHVDGGRTLVEWLRLPSSVLGAPFLGRAITTFVRRPRVERLVSDFRLLEAVAIRHEGDARMDCVIAHMSRCGSTLLSSCMKQVGDVTVLSEPPIVYSLLQGRYEPRLLRGVLGRYAAHFGRPRLAVKLNSASTMYLRCFREAFPFAPAVLLVRNPVEVAVSNLREPSGFMRLRDDPEAASSFLGIPEAAIRGCNEAEYCALVLGAYLRAMLAEKSQPRTRIVDYAALDSESISRLIVSIFGPIRSAQHARIAKRSLLDAKNPKRRFEPDSDRKRALATPELRALLREAGGLYQELSEHRTPADALDQEAIR